MNSEPHACRGLARLWLAAKRAMRIVLVASLIAVALAPGRGLAAGAGEFRTKFDREIAPGQPVLVSTRVDKPPTIDGEVDKDPVWPTCGRTHGAWAR